MRRRLISLTAAIMLAMGLGPAGAMISVPVLMTDNVEMVGFVPDVSIVAATFDPEQPVMYTTTLSGFRTWDISNPEQPTPLGNLAFPHFSNENVKLGVREDGTRLVLAGFDLVGYQPDAGTTDTRGTNRFVVIDVSDPTAPAVAASVNTNTRTHTMGCANTECSHAYTAGSGGKFDIYDLTDITAPEHVQTYETDLMLGNRTFGGGIGHDWDLDEAGVAWLVGSGGIVAFDTTDPANPRVMNSSDHRSTDEALNRYVSHNSQRPNAAAFDSRAPEDVIASDPWDYEIEQRDPAALRAGEILFVTEEDLSSDPRCTNRGGFQAWQVQELDADRYATDINPGGERDAGTIAPIGKWTTEAAEVDDPVAAANVGAFCSAHYFDVHDSGIVAHAWYQQGLRFLDARDPSNIVQIGYFITGAQEIFGAKWVPEYDEEGRQTGAKTNLLYTEDPSRGIDILRVELPEDGEDAERVVAPILPQWAAQSVELANRGTTPGFGQACLLPR